MASAKQSLLNQGGAKKSLLSGGSTKTPKAPKGTMGGGVAKSGKGKLKAKIKEAFTTSNENPSKLQKFAQGPGLALAIGAGLAGAGLAMSSKSGRQKIVKGIKNVVQAPKKLVENIKENQRFKQQQRDILRQKQQDQTPKPTFNRRAGSKVPRATK